MVGLNFPARELLQLKAEALAKGVPHSELIRIILIDWLKDTKTPHSAGLSVDKPVDSVDNTDEIIKL